MWKIHFITIDNETTDIDRTMKFNLLEDFISQYGDFREDKRLPERTVDSLRNEFKSYLEGAEAVSNAVSYVAVTYRYLYTDRDRREVVYERVQS